MNRKVNKERTELNIQELNSELYRELEKTRQGSGEETASNRDAVYKGKRSTKHRHSAQGEAKEASGDNRQEKSWTDKHDGTKRTTNERFHKSTEKKKPRKVSPVRVLLVVLCVCIFLTAGVAGVVAGLKAKGQKQLQQSKVTQPITAPEEVQLDEEGKYVIYNNKKYCYNEDIVTILCMGVDKSIQETSGETIGENGQADTLVLFVLDTKTGKLTLLNIPRDSMVDVNKYNVQGQFLNTQKMQICLAYAYGDGKEKSCVNVMESVSRLMYGMPIHGYAAIDLDSIRVLNDAVGGVTVEVMEDLSHSDSQLLPGNVVKLNGNQAHLYVRSRDVEKLDSNNNRMERQKQYLQAFIKTALEKTRQDIKVPLVLYQTAEDYMVTDLGASQVAYLASLVLNHGMEQDTVKSVPGQVVKGEIYAEFVPDESGLYEMILDTFYKEEERKS